MTRRDIAQRAEREQKKVTIFPSLEEGIWWNISSDIRISRVVLFSN